MKKLYVLFCAVLMSSCLYAQGIPEMSLKQKKTCNQLIPFWEKFTEMPKSKYVLLYHVMNLFDSNYSLKNEENIRNYGLLSANELVLCGFGSKRKELKNAMILLGKDESEELPFEFDVIYFVPQEFFYGTKLNEKIAPSRVVRYLVRSKDYNIYDGLQRREDNVVKNYEATKQPLSIYTYDPTKSMWEYFPETFTYGSIPPDKLIFYYSVTEYDTRLAQEQETAAQNYLKYLDDCIKEQKKMQE